MQICCPFCSFHFDSLQWLCVHLREMASIDLDGHGLQFKMECQFCGANSGQQQFSASEMVDHLRICHPTQQNCQKIVLAHSTLNEPNRLPRRQCPPNYKCQFCLRTFRKSIDLRRHERTHTGERPFVCRHCSSRFKLKQTLETHLRVHRGPNSNNVPMAEQFHCSVCQKAFLSRSALKLHLRIHTGETPFKCAQHGCAECFRTKKLMMTHFRQIHQQNDLQSPTIDGPNQIASSSSDTHRIEYIFEDFDEQRVATNDLINLSANLGPKCSKKTNGQINWSANSAFSKFNGVKANVQQPTLNQSAHVYCPSVVPEASNPLMHSSELGTKSHQNHLGPTNNSQSTIIQQFMAPPPESTSQMFIRPSISAHQPQIHHHLPQHQSTSQMPPPFYFQMADAEYTRQGQVHGRSDNPPPSHQFRTLTPPNFVCWLQQ